jgi:hypothetical protein
MRSLLAAVGFTFISLVSYAQPTGSTYSTAIGVKVYPGSISVKHLFEQNKAVEGLLYLWNYGVRATALYEIHGDINGAPGLKWYLGPGAHIGFWNSNWRDVYPTRESGLSLGIDGVIGLDYKINGAPINISLDWQPSFNLIGYTYFEGGWGGLGIRYTLQ